MQPLRNTIEKGFTLVELLIVVIILALLAAIVVPQFASSTDDAKLASLDTTLGNIRSAVDLYYQQHGEYPGELTAVDAACTGTAGTGTGGAGAQGAQAFLDQMSLYTDADGGACSVKDANFQFGPYLKKNTLPPNPITAVSTLEVINTGDLLMAGTGANLGWKYDYVVGKFIANDTTDPDAAGPLPSYDQR
ncbi:MAG: prepilin-type N-terminal cleavage/methylation domain-containing protein [Gammaproteobacteria bacterium]|nr:prepilin-type N-terminal cleavage/methylation domain-containing protein [Gammaproteobacteria bacterium]